MSLATERAEYFRRHAQTAPAPLATTISLNALALRAKLSKRAILVYVHQRRLAVEKVKTRHNWRWEVAAGRGGAIPHGAALR